MTEEYEDTATDRAWENLYARLSRDGLCAVGSLSPAAPEMRAGHSLKSGATSGATRKDGGVQERTPYRRGAHS
ncbi:MAG: hypothetical protein LBP64_01190 [Tannerella sp.]|jgi:hypothetical protein|nr:hypothetical protein [Tannerella sp.]